MIKHILALTLFFTVRTAIAQDRIDPSRIDIVRDSFGVPHIYAATDAAVAYGLAYAHAEDDYKTIQTSFLAGKSMLARYSGKSGAAIDYVCQLLRCREIVEEKYEQDISPAYKKVLQGYCDGINSYAKQHSNEVLVKQLFPLTPKDMLSYSLLQLSISCGADKALQQIFRGSIPVLNDFKPGGSNAYAFNSRKTTDGSTFLNINAHQPLEGPVSWYEAHLCSEEGWNIIGALFPCAPSILLGVNENLGWAHTVNNPDKLDVYQLEMNPQNKLQYRFDNEWLTLEEKQAHLKVKMMGLKIGAKRKIWWSKYGPTVVTDRGVFAIRTGALMDIRSLEQWYHMNKARNFTEFYQALQMGAIPGYNVIYADRYDTIFYLSNGKMPYREKGYRWRSTVPGNTSHTLWTRFHPISELPHYLNPASGYLFNSNHSPFNASAAADNIKESDYDATMSYENWDNNRSIRFMNLLAPLQKISYEDFKRIKFDRQLPQHLYYTGCKSDTLFLLDEKQYPAIADIILSLKQWDHRADVNSKGAAAFCIAYYYTVEKLAGPSAAAYRNLSVATSVEVLTYVKDYLQKNFGRTDITLGEYQKLVRGDKAIPLPGLPDVIASMESEPWKNGMVKGRQGESYIELVRFTKAGPEIESIHSYGASNKKESPHYADQMEMFVQQKMKKMTLNKKEVYSKAERVYHPL